MHALLAYGSQSDLQTKHHTLITIQHSITAASQQHALFLTVIIRHLGPGLQQVVMDMPEQSIRPMYMSCFLVYCLWLLCLPAGYPSSCKQIVTQAIKVHCHCLICSSVLYQASNRALCSSAHCPCQMQKGCGFPTCIQHGIMIQWHAKAADFLQMQSFMLCAVFHAVRRSAWRVDQVCQPITVRFVCIELTSQPASQTASQPTSPLSNHSYGANR